MGHLTSAIKHTEMVPHRMGKCRHLPQWGVGCGGMRVPENMSDDPSVSVCMCVLDFAATHESTRHRPDLPLRICVRLCEHFHTHTCTHTFTHQHSSSRPYFMCVCMHADGRRVYGGLSWCRGSCNEEALGGRG